MRPTTRSRAIFTVLVCFAALVVLALAWTATALAVDPGNPLWTRLYGNAGNQAFEEAAGCPGGDVVVAGTTDQGVSHVVVARYSASGARRWVKVLDPSSTTGDYVIDLHVDGAGNAVALCSRTLVPSGSQYLVCKFSPTGRLLWKRLLSGLKTASNRPCDLALGATGDAYVTGGWTTAESVKASCTARLRARDGKVLMQSVFTGPHTLTVGYSLVVDKGGNAYVTGSGDRGDGRNETVTLKLRPTGTVAWLKEVPAAGTARSAGAQIALAGSRLYAVSAVGPSGPSNTILTVLYTTAGTEKWRDELNVPAAAMDGANAATTDRYGNLFVAGTSSQAGLMAWAYVARWTPTRARWLWAKPSTDPDRSGLYSVIADQSGGCWVGGQYTIAPATSASLAGAYAARVSKSGASRWEQVQVTPGMDISAHEMAACSGGLVFSGTLRTGSVSRGDDARVTLIHR